MLFLQCILVSCSSFGLIFDENYEEIKKGREKSNIKATWYEDAPKRYKAIDTKTDTDVHYFFDPSPDINQSNSTLNFIAVTPEDSKVRFGFDTLSGKVYAEKRFCTQKDIFNKYSSSLSTPPFTMGVVPRLLDQIGEPQNIIVFGNKDYYQKRYFVNYDKVRVVGGVIEKKCLHGICAKHKDWISHLVLVAVDPRDSSFVNTYDLTALKEQIDWKHVEAFLVNGRGVNNQAGKVSPGFKLSGEVRADQAILFVRSHGHLFNDQEMTKMKMSCYKLYDFVWDNIGQTNMKKNFIPQFKLFGKKFFNKYQTCMDFVRYSSINDDYQRHWFMTYFTAFMKLYKIGNYYNCANNGWWNNPINKKNERIYNLQEELVGCGPFRLDGGFKRLSQYMSDLQKFNKEYIRYVTYDDLSFGTHDKIYSFVSVPGKKLNCSHSDSEYNISYQIFPKDVHWDYLPQSMKFYNKNKDQFERASKTK